MSEQIMSAGKALQEFQQPGQSDIFPDARQLPQFFKQNLIDEARVIKCFENDPQANLRVFYYQYLKLCFQFDNPNSEHYVNKIYELISKPQFLFKFPADAKGQFYSDKQFKRLLIQFFDFMAQGGLTVNKALSILPIMDFVLICFFRSFLLLTGKASSFESFIEREPLYEFLTSQFNVEATVHDNCMKFVDTDIFAYQQNPYQVFMVYIDYQRNLQPCQSENLSYDSTQQRNHNKMQSIQLQKLSYDYNCESRDISQSHSREYSSVIQSHENSMIASNQNQMVRTNNNYTNTVMANKDNQQQNSYAKRKQMLSYMGNSQIYDFVDYTNPNRMQKSQNQERTITKESSDFQLQKKFTQIQRLQQLVSQDQKRRNEQQLSSSRMQTSIMNNKSSLSNKKESVKFAPDVIEYGQSTNSINQLSSQKQVIAESNRQKQAFSQKSQFQGTFNAKSNPNDVITTSFHQPSTQNQTYQNSPSIKQQKIFQNALNTKANYISISNKPQFLQKDKYGLDSVVPDFNSFTVNNHTNNLPNIFSNNNLTGFSLTSPKNSSISTNFNSNFKYGNPANFANQTFDEKMKRMTNQQLGPDHNSKLEPISITNDAYLNRGVQKMEPKNKTSNLEYGKISNYTYDSSLKSNLQGKTNLIIPDQEFTDSFTLQNVNQPQRSTIKQIKSRARAQRRSVGGGFI